MLGVGVLEQLCQLQGVFADFLHGGEQEAIQGDVNHLLQQPAGLEEVNVLIDLGETRQLHARVGVVVAVLRVDLEFCLLQGTVCFWLMVCSAQITSSHPPYQAT